VEQPLIEANSRFAFKLFARLVEQEPDKNIFISPISIALALAMTYNGAAGETARAMAETLELGEMSLEALNQASAELLRGLGQIEPQIQLAIGSSLWMRQGIGFQPDFLQRSQQFYAAFPTSLDFGAPDSVAQINAWVSQQTNGLIAEIIDRLDPLAILVLLNAIFFKGIWRVPFDPGLTSEHLFTLADGQQKSVPMMQGEDTWSVYWDGMLAGISLPYGAGRVRMDIFLPDEKGGLAGFYSRLHATNWQLWIRQFRPVEGKLVMPRFKLEYEASLNDALSALGMEVAFDPQRADFSGMCRTQADRVAIGQVLHKAFVEVDEQGTEATAVTMEDRALGMVMGDKRFKLVIDRPFFFAIRDAQTNAILFLGSIVDP
jgi:serine protease inhibitor